MSDVKLEPCPHCGGEALFYVYEQHRGEALIECQGCPAVMGDIDGKALIAAWNRRSPLTAAAGTVPGEGWREGVEAAAKEAERWAGIWSEPSNVTKALPEISKSFVRAAECITDAIRALPSPPIQPPADEVLPRDTGHAMACHEHTADEEVHCVGWLVNQLGVGNNIGLRLRMLSCENKHAITVDGPQHTRFEDTLP